MKVTERIFWGNMRLNLDSLKKYTKFLQKNRLATLQFWLFANIDQNIFLNKYFDAVQIFFFKLRTHAWELWNCMTFRDFKHI